MCSVGHVVLDRVTRDMNEISRSTLAANAAVAAPARDYFASEVPEEQGKCSSDTCYGDLLGSEKVASLTRRLPCSSEKDSSRPDWFVLESDALHTEEGSRRTHPAACAPDGSAGGITQKPSPRILLHLFAGRDRGGSCWCLPDAAELREDSETGDRPVEGLLDEPGRCFA